MMSRSALDASQRNHGLRGLAAILVIAIVLPGCGVVGRTSVKTVQIAMQGRPNVEPTVADVAANRYPQIKVTGARGGAILVLGNLDGDRQAWYSSDHSIVFLEDGLLVGTHGGTPELQAMRIEGENPFRNLHRIQAPIAVQRRYDIMPGYRFGVQISGTLERIGTENVQILGRSLSLLHIRERLIGQGWKHDNHYWVDPSNGFIWKSVQALAPDASLEIIQLKPYSPDLKH
jgi:hypothetical protein